MNKTRHKHLENALIRLRKRIRRVQWLRGSAQCLAVLLFALLVLVVVDQRFAPLPQGTRWAMFLGWLALGGAAAWLRLVRPLSEPLDTVRLARWLETRHPELDERASTVLELDDGRGTSGASDTLLADLAVEAARDLDAICPDHEVNLRKTKPWLVALGVLAGIWLLLFVLWPSRTARHLARVLAPASDLGTASWRILVAPGDADVMEAAPVEIRARIKGQPLESPLEIVLRMNDGTEVVEPMKPAPDGGAVFRLEKAEQDFSYYVRAGRETSDRHWITVWPLPRLADPRVRLEFPAYTNLPAREISVGNPDAQINAVAGTRATLRAGLNTTVESGRLEIDAAKRAQARLDRGADGGRLEISWSMEKPEAAVARVILTHPIGGDFEALRFPANTLPDTAPEIRWLAPAQDELRLRPDDAFQFSWQANDDIGLAAATLEVSADPGGTGSLPLTLPDRLKKSDPPTWRGEGAQPLGALIDRWPHARSFRIRVHVRDGRTRQFGGPNSAATPWKQIVIDRNAPSQARQELLAQNSDAKETITKARRDAYDAMNKLNRQRDNVTQGKRTEENRRMLAEARAKLAEARDSLRKLSERMQEGVHAASTPKVEQAAETLEKALEQSETAPLSDDPATRKQQMTGAQTETQNAIHQLEKVLDEINRRQSQVFDLAKLKTLELQQRELARKAANQAATPPTANNTTQSPESAQNPPESPNTDASPQPTPQWRNEQKNTASAIRRAALERPQTRAQILAEQARQARDLAEQAARQANTQRRLAEAVPNESNEQATENQTPQNNPQSPDSQSSRNTPTPQDRDALRQALAREQSAIARQTEEHLAEARQRRQAAANSLPQAAEATRQAAEDLQKNNPPPAADEAKSAASAMREAAQAQRRQTRTTPKNKAATPTESGNPSHPASPEQAQSTASRPQPSNSAPPEKNIESMAAAEELSNLADRQEQLAEAIEAFAKGNDAEARAAMAKLAAQQTKQLAEDIASLPMAEHSESSMQRAEQASRSAAKQAEQAARQANQQSGQTAQSGNSESAQQEADAHGKAAEKLDETAASLSRAAEAFARRAAQSANSRANQNKAPASPEALAEAFSQAAQAANADSAPQAAAHAAQAAQALSQATRSAMRAMQGRDSSQGQGQQQGQPQQQAQNNSQNPSNGKADPNANSPQEGYRSPQADPGVPPELAKLGISSEDWAKIKASIKSETGGAPIQIPEEYRALVRQYFEEMAKEK